MNDGGDLGPSAMSGNARSAGREAPAQGFGGAVFWRLRSTSKRRRATARPGRGRGSR